MEDSSVHTSNNNSKENRDDKKSNDDSDTTLEFSEDEELLIARMFKLVGERWSLIAGRIPGRSAEEIEKYWTSKYNSSSLEI